MVARSFVARVVGIAGAAAALALGACVDGTTPDCDSGTVNCGYPPPPPVGEGGGGDGGATDGDAGMQQDGAAEGGGGVRRAAAALALALGLAVALGACAEGRRSLGEACLKDTDCLSGICS